MTLANADGAGASELPKGTGAPGLVGIAAATAALFLSNAIFPPMLHLLQERHGLAISEVSLIQQAPLMAHLIAGVAAGVWSDRIGRRMRFLSVGLAGAGLCTFAIPLMDAFPAILALRFAQGFFDALAATLLFAAAADRASDANPGRTMAVIGAAVPLGYLLGQPVAATADLFLQMPFAISGGLLLAASLSLVRHSQEPAALAPHVVAPLRAFREVLAVRALRPALIFHFIDKFTFAALALLTSVTMGERFGIDSVSASAIVFSGFWAGYLAAAWPSGRISDRVGALPLMLAASGLYGMCLVGMGFASLPLFAGLMVLAGILSALMFTPCTAIVAHESPAGGRGTAMGVFQGVGILGLISGFAVTGMLSDRSVAVAYTASGMLEVLAAVGVFAITRGRFGKRSVASGLSPSET